MNYNNDNDMWEWQDEQYFGQENTSIDVSKGLVNQNKGNPSYMFDDETTPLKACGDLAYHVTGGGATTGKELEQYNESSSQVKRRRMLQFDPDEAFLRSKETRDSLDGIAELSEWVAGFSENNPSSEGWIDDCFNDAEMHFNTEDDSASGVSDVQIDITELCDNNPPEYDAKAVKKHHVQTRGNVVFTGRKSYMRTPPKLASSVVYPFAFIKPCGVHGDVTLKDINQRIHNPPKSLPNSEDPSSSFLTSAFSGKLVVGKTKIRTEGGKGSITIMRTKG